MYALSQAIRALRQHPVSTLATFTTATVSFMLLFLIGLVLWNLERVVTSIQNELEIAAFLDPSANTQSVEEAVRTLPGVRSVRLISKEAALAQLQLDYPYLAQAQSLVKNPLPDTLKVHLLQSSKVRKVAGEISGVYGVSSVEYGGQVTENLVGILGGIRVGTNVLIFLLVLDTFFSVMGTIRLSIENRREELRVMMLVGATRGFIRAPFVLEGIMMTLLAALLALTLGNTAYRYTADLLQSLLPFIPVLSADTLLRASEGLLVLAVFLGGFGAWLSSRAYLKDTDIVQ